MKVRLGDVDTRGRMRLDAIARFLQDVGHDDAVSVDHPSGVETTWVVRRVSMRIAEWPRFMDVLESRTWCSGIGQRWAERSTTFDARVEATALWVYVDAKTLAPLRLPPSFYDRWGAAAGGRKVSGRLGHTEPPASVEWRPWPLRATDFDVLDHMNNAAYWHVVEEHLAAGRWPLPTEAEIEYRSPVNVGASVFIATTDDGRLWLRGGDGTVHASVVLG